MLEPDVLARIARLELVATQAVEGFLSGKHPSPYHGSSVEYADHRPYVPGDPIRTIDWKLLAKTDKAYIKLYEEQTNVRATIVVDASESMTFGSGGTTKFEFARRLAAALAYLMVHQNDAVGLALFDGDVREYVPARCTASHFRRMLETLEAARARSDTRIATVLHALAGRLRRRGMVILISDLLDDPSAIANGLAHFRHLRHDVIVFHVVHDDEMTFPYDRLVRFRDAEGVGMTVVNPRAVRRQYLQRLNRHIALIRNACQERGVSYEQVRTSQAYDHVLSTYLAKRARVKRTAKV